MKLVLDNGQEIILSQETNEVIMQEIENKMKPKRNFCDKKEDSWYIQYDGNIDYDYADEDSLKFLNSFTNVEYAKKIARRQYIDRLILNFIDENRVNWFDKNNSQKEKYSPYYNHVCKCLDIDTDKFDQINGWVFPTKELAQQCIDKYKDELIEFFTMEV